MKNTLFLLILLMILLALTACNKIELSECENITIEKIVEVNRTVEVIREVPKETIKYINKTVYVQNTTNYCIINYTPNLQLIKELKRCEDKINETWDMVVCREDLEECEAKLENIRDEVD